LLLLTTVSKAQYSLSSAGGKSSMVAVYDRSLISYDFSSDNATFTWGTDNQPAPLSLASDTIYPTLDVRNLFNVSLSVPVTKKVRSIFESGDFKPEFELGSDFIFDYDTDETSKLFFLRAVAGLEQNDYFTIENEIAELSEEQTWFFDFGGGVNWGLSTRTVVGLSLLGSRNLDSPFGLKERTVAKSQQSGTTIDGKTLTIQEEVEAFNGSSTSYWNGEFRADFSTCFTSTDSDHAGFGMIMSTAWNPRDVENKNNPINFSIGHQCTPPITFAKFWPQYFSNFRTFRAQSLITKEHGSIEN